MQSFLDFTIELAEKAGQHILKSTNIQVEEKATNDFVTNVDKETEELIINTILAKYPDHGIMGEENDPQNTQDAEYIWIIDPIDGTTNFMHGIPFYSVSIALLQKTGQEDSKNFEYISGEVITGCVHAPRLNETYYAAKGEGAYMNGQKIQVSKVPEVRKSVTMTGFPATHKELNLPYYALMMNEAQAVRRFGSAAIDLCYIAKGCCDVFWEFGLSPWDIAAGSLIVEEAGGQVTDTNGQLLDLAGKDILATNGLVHEEVIDKFSKL